MNVPRNNPSEIKDRLSAELEARIPERQVLLDEAAAVFNEHTTLQDCPDNNPDYIEQSEKLRLATDKFTELKAQLPATLSFLQELEPDEVFEAINVLMDDPNFMSRPAEEVKNLQGLRRASNDILQIQSRIDVNYKAKSGALRRIDQAKKRLSKPNPEKLEEVAKAYGEICDLLDGHKFEIRRYMHRSEDISDANMIRHKVEEFNEHFSGLLSRRYFGERTIKSYGPEVQSFKAKMKSPVESRTNNGITIQLSTTLDGWWIDIALAEEYHTGVGREFAERQAILDRDRDAEETRNGTSESVRSVYSDGGSSSSGREKA